MPIQNSDVADIFEKVADFLELAAGTNSTTTSPKLRWTSED